MEKTRFQKAVELLEDKYCEEIDAFRSMSVDDKLEHLYFILLMTNNVYKEDDFEWMGEEGG